MQSGSTTRARFQLFANALLVVSLLANAWYWLDSEAVPELDKVVVKVPLQDNLFFYGARDNSGGATTSFSYRYYITQESGDDASVLEKLAHAQAFLVSDDDEVNVSRNQGAMTLEVKGRVLQYRSDALVNTTDGLKNLHFSLQQAPAPRP
ncbi:hypothetical protein LZ023_13950 [Pseudomonas silvicola]|nr:hypothetical protein LZ023_13950 [Pseudomonas silvicola]